MRTAQVRVARQLSTFGTLALWLSSLLVAGCTTPPRSEVEIVRVDARRIALEHSSLNAEVAGTDVAQSFAAAVDSQTQTPTVTRLESSLVRSIAEGEESLRVGDSVSSVGMWGSAVRFGGMQFGTRDKTRADVVSTQLATQGLAVLPTVADALFASLEPDNALAAQKVSVKRSARAAGANGLGLTARDALGRTRAIDAPILSATRLVDEGCDDFSVGLGKVRRDYAITSNEYGPLFANTTVTCGAPLGFTVEGHGEYLADEVAALGVGLARKVGSLGTASFALASSHADVGAGWLARVGFEHRNPIFNVAVGSRMQSREFREIHTLAVADPIMQRDLASVGINVTESSTLSLSYATQTTWLRERSDLIAVRQSLRLGSGSLSMSAGHSQVEDVGSSLFISYQRPFGTKRRERSELEEFDLSLLGRPGNY